MKRFLLLIVFCSPFLLSSYQSFAINLIGPNGERANYIEQYGPISNIETLWGIASKLRPDNSVSILQTLVAIYKLNPDVFLDGNINKIMPQSVIQIPRLDMIQQQTNREASLLLKRYSIKKHSVKKSLPIVIKKSITPVASIKEENLKNTSLKLDVPLPITSEASVKKIQEETTETTGSIKNLQMELVIINEELLLSKEENKKLKLKLQLMYDQVNTLSEQMEADRIILQEKNDKITSLELKLESKLESAFSGSGMLNEILRFITSSLTHLLIVILSPVLLLLTGLVLMMHIRNKRQLVKEKQELAESTTTLTDTSEGLFDELLTEDDIEKDLENNIGDDIELDFSTNVEKTETEFSNSKADAEVIDLNREVAEKEQKTIESIMEEDLINEVDFDASDVQTTEEDPFGIDALVDLEKETTTEKEDVVSEKTNDSDALGENVKKSESTAGSSERKEAEESLKQTDSIKKDAEESINTESNENTQVNVEIKEGIETEELELELESLDASLDELVASEPELEETTVEDVTNNDEPIVNEVSDKHETEELELESLDASLDELVEPELEETTVEDVTNNDEPIVNEVSDKHETEELEFESLDASLDELVESELEETTAEDVTNNDEPIANEVSDKSETEELELESLDTSLDELVESELEETTAEALTNEKVAENDEPIANEVSDKSETEELELESLDTSLDELVESELEETTAEDVTNNDEPIVNEVSDKHETEELELESLDTSLDELVASEQDDVLEREEKSLNDNDLLAKKLSKRAFNFYAPLPKVKGNKNEFIDIDALLEDSNGKNNEEMTPDLDLDLDFSLNDFPDVVKGEMGIDVDNDENGIDAQLDLARAYIEIDDKIGAKKILLSLHESTDKKQKSEIAKLLSLLT